MSELIGEQFENGFRGMMHEARTDLSMLFGSLFLLIVGAGAWSIDRQLSAHRVIGESRNG